MANETAGTLIKSALRAIGVLAKGETPAAEDSQDGLEALQFMLQNWSATGIRVSCVTSETLTFSANPSTIGLGLTLDTARPEKVLTSYLDDNELTPIDASKYWRLYTENPGGLPRYIYFSDEYPNGKIYVYSSSTGTLRLNSLKPLTDPTNISSVVYFPQEYNDAIKWNLAVRLAPEYGKTPSPEIVSLALSTLKILESKNFGNRIPIARPEIIKIGDIYNIDEG